MTAGPDSASLRCFAAAALVAVCAACNGDITGGRPVCGQEAPLEPGVPTAGALRDGDDVLAGAYIDYYSLQLPDTARLVVTMASTEIDPLLLLLDDDGDVVDQAFDSIGTAAGVEETASLTRAFPAGCHLVGASSWTQDTTGAYLLTVVPVPPQGPPDPAP